MQRVPLIYAYSPFKDTVLELEYKLIKNILFPVFTKQKENH